jgi:hypothetical protein
VKPGHYVAIRERAASLRAGFTHFIWGYSKAAATKTN